jgi:hypothetical protein
MDPSLSPSRETRKISFAVGSSPFEECRAFQLEDRMSLLDKAYTLFSIWVKF